MPFKLLCDHMEMDLYAEFSCRSSFIVFRMLLETRLAYGTRKMYIIVYNIASIDTLASSLYLTGSGLVFQLRMTSKTINKKKKNAPTTTCTTDDIVAPIATKKSHDISFVLHISPITFRGAGSSGPLSRCPEVKYSMPFQNPTRVVLTRKGSFPITDHFSVSN